MFKETIEYEVPGFDRLKEEFKEAAEISKNKRVIKVGDLTAERTLFNLALSFLLYKVFNLSSTNKNDELHDKCLVGNDINDLIDIMADHEARKKVSENAKDQALADALEKKAREIRTKGVSFG